MLMPLLDHHESALRLVETQVLAAMLVHERTALYLCSVLCFVRPMCVIAPSCDSIFSHFVLCVSDLFYLATFTVTRCVNSCGTRLMLKFYILKTT